MDYKNLIPAPIDGKNITEDWIEEMFDFQCAATNCKGKYLGFVNNVAVECTILNNELHWSCTDGWLSPHREYKEKALEELMMRIQQRFDDERIHINYRRWVDGFYTLVTSFYWNNND